MSVSVPLTSFFNDVKICVASYFMYRVSHEGKHCTKFLNQYSFICSNRAPTTLKSEGEVTSLSGADKREVRDNREKSKYFSNCTTFHIHRALSGHLFVIMYLLCIKVYSVVV